MPGIVGYSHVDLTVTDCERAATWWREVLGFTLVHQARHGTFEVRSMVHPSGLVVTLLTHDETTKNDAFDERRVGLDHLAFRVADQEVLQRWATHLDAKGVVNTGVIDTGFGPTIVFRDPDNTQLELYVQADMADVTWLSEGDTEEAQRALQGEQ